VADLCTWLREIGVPITGGIILVWFLRALLAEIRMALALLPPAIAIELGKIFRDDK